MGWRAVGGESFAVAGGGVRPCMEIRRRNRTCPMKYHPLAQGNGYSAKSLLNLRIEGMSPEGCGRRKERPKFTEICAFRSGTNGNTSPRPSGRTPA